MNKNTALVITSISAPNAVLAAYAEGCRAHDLDFIVIGDVSSPPDFSLDGCDFWSIERQRSYDSQLARTLPERHYARKNLGYLIAIKRGAQIIIETDDDNFPYPDFWEARSSNWQAPQLKGSGWTNVYRYFTETPIWPRGFPLEHVQIASPELPENSQSLYCPIQQGLADTNPDVDAVYRLVLPLPVDFAKRPPVALGSGSWSPFNSQNTTWFEEAFPLLYIPSYCSFRMCDIWRSFIAQRICWANDWPLLFHEATVYQERNEHDLLRDFRDEVDGYLNNARICEELAALDIKKGPRELGDNLRKCYERLIGMRLIGSEEMQLLDFWLLDLETVAA